jgi:hypothetical protein
MILNVVWCQFHQHFTCAFFVRKCFSLVTFWQKKALSYKKRAHKMLMKLTSAGISNLLLHRLDCWIQGRCRELKATSVFYHAKLSKRRHCLDMCARENKCMTVTFSGKENKCLFFTKVCEKIDVTGKYCFITMKYTGVSLSDRTRYRANTFVYT